jgi:hypothetical protein
MRGVADLMYDLNFKIHGLDYPVRYTYKDCIFVFEDVRAEQRYGCATVSPQPSVICDAGDV